VRALYREEGFTRVRIEPAQIALAAEGDSAEVDVTLFEGPRFTVGDVTFSSDVAAVSDEELRADAAAHRRSDLLPPSTHRNRNRRSRIASTLAATPMSTSNRT
jgi:outer membrane protein assembly factor BamA